MTEATEMEIRVARALHAAEEPSGSGRCDIADYVSLAKVAIRAMREPTEEMVKRAYDPTENFGKAVCEAMWQAMIDAASPER